MEEDSFTCSHFQELSWSVLTMFLYLLWFKITVLVVFSDQKLMAVRDDLHTTVFHRCRIQGCPDCYEWVPIKVIKVVLMPG